ncbi:leucine-rich repeat-containing G-protein coupled receptor 6-like [Seriola lalandi dorsalis]|uniref:leucine-rich repeat-containing G-protein coupled receptor 6-like n=1 Tax=Seriola lalandi dorsalis TaxID=1841481 RepID=UPI000C6F486D|nr:leucine-rich repeat-containing G-protein coupled receptor 6-like [Seriola lalandi dorsalis]
MISLLVFFLTCVGVVGGGGRRSTCPALCRCEGVGMLQSVDCVDADLRSVPSDLSSFTSSLRLAGNSLSEIDREAFTGLTGLRLLDLQNNQLSRVPSEALENLKNLKSLPSWFPHDGDKRCPAFTQDVTDGVGSEISKGCPLKSTKRREDRLFVRNPLGLSDRVSSRLDANFISRPAASSFKGLTSLRHLWLDDNRLTEVPVLALSSLTQLHALTLALNNISSVPDQAFSALSQLLVL